MFIHLYKRVQPFLVLFLVSETLMRLVFLIRESAHLSSWKDILASLRAGLFFDLTVFTYFLIPLTLYLLLLPRMQHGMRCDRIFSGILFGLLTCILLFTSVSEWFFWDEFTARFNFIAVDYLVYTHEVIGNIRESYPVIPILLDIAICSAIAGWRFRHHPLPVPQPPMRARAVACLVALGLAVASFVLVQSDWANIGDNRYQHEIAKNGIYELFSAYRHNDLNYAQFYSAEEEQSLLERLRTQLRQGNEPLTDAQLTRQVDSDGVEKHRNIVMITVESLSGDYLKTFGNQENLTPYLNSLVDQSLFFTNLYATGTRTVYGLSALTLSIPPIPGNSIVRRPENEHLFSLGSVLNAKGYVSKFIYGGFGYFDNMNHFFEHNGYHIVDRMNLSKQEITFANVWGVADGDLFRRTLRENDEAHAQGKPFFDMIMTTSNHRPFTYPDGKIDIPSHSGRKGGVKYTDYAIRQFIEEAKKHPWFANTIFVIVADHTAGGAGKSELDPAAYHIPLFIYAPGIIAPRKVETLASQIDVAPTLLGLLNMDYTSRFYGADILRHPPERAFISNYLQLGYMTRDDLLIIKPVKQMAQYARKSGEFYLLDRPSDARRLTALSYFQNATRWKDWNQALPPQEAPGHPVGSPTR